MRWSITTKERDDFVKPLSERINAIDSLKTYFKKKRKMLPSELAMTLSQLDIESKALFMAINALNMNVDIKDD